MAGVGNENITELGKKFEKGNQAAKGKGRPKSVRGLIDRFCIEKGVKKLSRADRDELYMTLVVLTLKELTALVNDDKEPAIVRIVAKAILSGKGFEVIQQVNNTSLGDPNKQDISVTVNSAPLFQIAPAPESLEEDDPVT